MIHDIELIQFRNYHHFKTTFSDGINVIVGMNGVGKTNILEAIFMLAMTKSFRTNITKYTIEYDQEFAKIIGNIDKGKIEFILDNRLNFEKIYKFNDINKNLVDIFGLFNVVLFEPNDLNLIMFEPEKRRKYFNALISQLDKKYFDYLIRYNKCIKSRNKILENIYNKKSKLDELDFWNHQLIHYGSYIMAQRAKNILEINQKLSKNYKIISNKNQYIHIDYKSNIFDSNKNLEYYIDENNNKKIYKDLLLNSLNLDINTKKTNVGIHKDDFIFYLDKNKAKYFASRGEIRSIIISLKITEIDILTSINKDNITILLDDIFSELDEYRISYLLEIVSKYQTILTTTTILPNINAKKIIQL